MKHIKLLRSLVLATAVCAIGADLRAQIAISPGPVPASPNTKAMLDLNDVTRGFLAPRFTYANRPGGMVAADNSLLYYQTDSLDVAGVPQPRGYYYWDNGLAQWVHASLGSGWRVGGNSGTSAATNYIGTSNNMAMRIHTNGVPRIQLNAAPGYQVQVGTIAPATEQFEVNGAMRVYSTASPTSDPTPLEGAVRYNGTTGAHEGYVNNNPGAGQISYVGWYQLENAFKTRVKQKYASVPTVACAYPTPVVVPNGATVGSWLTIDNASSANFSSFSTLETPYSTFWEDGRHQYLYLASDLQALGVCPNTDVKGIAFQTSGAGTALGMRNVKVSMKNEGQNSLSDFVYFGWLQCATYLGPLVVVNGWNAHQFTTNWQWLGGSNNMLVEYCFDNQDWTSNTGVMFEGTAYNGTYGLYCDACGHPSGSATCYYAGPCGTPTFPAAGGGNWSPNPGGAAQLTPGIQCNGWGWNGLSGGGCAWTTTTSLITCDGTFQYQGAHTAAARRPILKIDAQTNGVTILYLNSSYLLASGEGVMIGDYASWANSANYASCAAYQFKGPGTISASNSVWGGTVLLSDHVFDNYYDGRIKPEDEKQAIGYRHYPMKEMASYVERERHLPTIAGRDEWNKEGMFSADQLTNQLWVTVETQSLYIKELNDRMNALQDYLVEKRLNALKK